jgi:hypothetical protein
MKLHDQNIDLTNLIMMQLHQWTTFGSESHMYFYQHFGAQNVTDGLVTMRAYMMNALAGKQQKKLN